MVESTSKNTEQPKTEEEEVKTMQNSEAAEAENEGGQ